MIDDFRVRWEHVRGLTNDFIREMPDQCLDFRPGATCATVREQAVHLCEVQSMYLLAMRGDEPDFSRKPEFSPSSDSREDILATLRGRDDELEEILGSVAASTDYRVSWYGSELTALGFGAVLIQHEAIHHGQWSVHAALAGCQTPISWLLNWGL